ncbi:MAG: hypothetical protein EXR98_00560 [Gemmataceae bacterium]|nr:hypothetical protein [Gemmataceae bacterium]
MRGTLILATAIAMAWLGVPSTSQAQVFVHAPFVRVAVGGGVSVRAPFVNLYIPENGPTYYSPFGPRVIYVQPMTPVKESFPGAQQRPNTEQVQPPVQQGQIPTLDAFAKTFQPKVGSFEVTILNPVTKQPQAVRFSLPEGQPRRVIVNRDSIEFVYGPRQFTRIEFDRDGVVVTTR